MNKHVLTQFILFFGAFFIVFIIPKPDLRIEKFKYQLMQNLNTIIIGNSILEHQSPCDIKRSTISSIYKDASVIGEGGILLEEIYLSLPKNNTKKNLILITAPYQFSQPFYYPLQTHMYYSKNIIDYSEILNYPVVKNSLWRLDETISVNDEKIKRGEASLIIKKMASQNRCGTNKINNKQLLDAIFIHSNNNFSTLNIQYELVRKLSMNYNLTVILIPVYLSDDYISPETIFKADNQLINIEGKLKGLGINYEVLNTQNDIINYDEPWCMCGHLSAKGRIMLENVIARLVNRYNHYY
jgi:hypothetical protein